jgi:hypothetical protein
MNAVTVDRAATPEQFATFFAVVARYLGVPVRLATGFRVPAAASTAGPLPPGSYQLTDRDAWTWDEVPVLGYGWVTVDPTPVRTTADVAPPPEQVTASPTTVPRQVTALPNSGAAHAIAKARQGQAGSSPQSGLAVGCWRRPARSPGPRPAGRSGWACPPCAGACGAGPGTKRATLSS